jgi:RNA polymerase sigma-70 factor (ECF subfamily)
MKVWNQAQRIDEASTSKARDLSEEEAIRLAQQGDGAAFEHLYRLHCRRVYGLCLRMVSNTSEAEDITQDVFLQLFRKIHTFCGNSAFSTWLYRLTVNMVLMRFRKRKHTQVSMDSSSTSCEADASAPIEIGGEDVTLTGTINRMSLQKALGQLPYGYKQMFILHDVEGYEHNEIAQILGCSKGNSKSQLHKARQRLRELLSEEGCWQGRKSSRKSRPAPGRSPEMLELVNT